MHIYLKNIPAEFHLHPILAFYEQRRHNQKKNKKKNCKITCEMGSVPDLRFTMSSWPLYSGNWAMSSLD